MGMKQKVHNLSKEAGILNALVWVNVFLFSLLSAKALDKGSLNAPSSSPLPDEVSVVLASSGRITAARVENGETVRHRSTILAQQQQQHNIRQGLGIEPLPQHWKINNERTLLQES